MRKRFVLALAFALALAIGCGGGSSNTPATPTPTSTSTTTTSVLATTTRNYTSGGGQVPSTAPSNMTLNFQWSSGGAGVENVYKVTGTYTTPSGGGGAVTGTLGGAVDPLQAGGQFQGTLTATVNGLAPANACTAERAFSGPLGPQSLAWTAGSILRDCSSHPLSFASVGLQRSDSTTTITTTGPSTTTTTAGPTTSTTTSVASTTTVRTTSTTSTTTTTTAPANLPDLVVVSANCDINQWVTVTIKNQGSGAAGASSTRLTFTSGTPQNPWLDVAAGGLAAGQQQGYGRSLDATSSAGCWVPSGAGYVKCTFSVTADGGQQVTESNESNNTLPTVSCLKAQG